MGFAQTHNWIQGGSWKPTTTIQSRHLLGWHSPSLFRPQICRVLGNSQGKMCWLVFINLTQAGVIVEEGTMTEKGPPTDWAVGKPVGHCLD